jgi:hypothetical protein
MTKKPEAAVADFAQTAEKKFKKFAPRAQKRLQERFPDHADLIEEKFAEVTPKVEGALQNIEPTLTSAVESVQEKLSGVKDAAQSHAEDFQSKAEDAKAQAQARAEDLKAQAQSQHLAPAQAKTGKAADKFAQAVGAVTIPAGLEEASKKLSGRSLKKAQKQIAAQAAEAAKQAQKAAKANAKAGKQGKGGLIFGMIVTAAVAGVAIWKAVQPIEDPWKRATTVEPQRTESEKAAEEARQTARRAVVDAEPQATDNNIGTDESPRTTPTVD